MLDYKIHIFIGVTVKMCLCVKKIYFYFALLGPSHHAVKRPKLVHQESDHREGPQVDVLAKAPLSNLLTASIACQTCKEGCFQVISDSSH